MSPVDAMKDPKTEGAGAPDGGVLHLVIGAVQLEAAVQRRAGWERLPDVEIEDIAETHTSALAPVLTALTRLLALIPVGITEVRVLVAEPWLNTASLLWSSDLRNTALAEAQARLALVAAGCEPAIGDLVRIDDAPYGALRWVVSYPGLLMEALRQLAQGCGGHLRSVRPTGIAAWVAGRGQGARDGALGVCAKGVVTVLTGGRWLTEVHTQTVTPDVAPLHGLSRLWSRLRLRDPALATMPQLPVLDLDAVMGSPADAVATPLAPAGLTLIQPPASAAALPAAFWLAQVPLARTAALDAVPAATARGWRAWWPVAAAAAVALMFSTSAWQSFGSVAGARTQLAAAQRAAAPVAVSAPVWTREELARVKAVNQAVRELNLPIDGLLAALQPPADLPVSVLGVDVSGAMESGLGNASGLSTLRLQAEAGNAIDMTRYVAFVGDRRPLVGAYLVRHEVVAAADGERRYRFTVEVTWRD